MKVVFFILSFIAIFNVMSNIAHYICGKKVYKNSKYNKSKKDQSNLYILVPVYKETLIAKKLVKVFNDLSVTSKVKVIIISTAKETDNKTHNLIKREIDKYSNNDIKIIKYPHKNGVMAHQLNYAIDYINSIDKTDYVIGIYNADSEVDRRTINFVRKNITNKNCIQQYAYFINENKSIMNGFVSWQNRWSFIFEAGRAKFNTLIKKNKFNDIFLKKLNYVIGHGLFIKKSVLEQVGNFPEDSINEDAFLGVLLNYIDIDVIPLPYFEKASFAPSVKVYIKQQCSWFNGPSRALSYFKKIKNNESNNKYKRNIFKASFKNTMKLLLVCYKIFLHAVYWISSIYAIILHGYLGYRLYGMYMLIIIILYGYINMILFNYLSYKNIKKSTKDNDMKFSIFQYPILTYFIHSFGPILNIIRTINKKNSISNKYKTER